MTTNGVKTVLTRRAIQWEEFLQTVIDEIEAEGYPNKVFKPALERLILRHSHILIIKKDIVEGFKGVQQVNKEVQSWMKGKTIAAK